ncbi:terminase small subunit [Rhodovulum visakhapatnamense]|nr:terminase small subunit [Rhodovulum visakhapatnamense]
MRVVVVMPEIDTADLRRRYPLPEGVEDAPMNRAQIARALNVSDNTITKWIAQGLPVLEEGGNGREYAFSPADCYAWRMHRDAETRAAKSAADTAAAQLAMAFRNLDEDDANAAAGLTARQIAEEAEADYKYQRAAEQRGELTRTARVRDLFEDMLVEFRRTVTTLVDYCEMEFSLDPEETAKLESRCDGALMRARSNLEIAIGRGAAETVPLHAARQNDLGL